MTPLARPAAPERTTNDNAGVRAPPPLIYAAGYAAAVAAQSARPLPALGHLAGTLAGGLLITAGTVLAVSAVTRFRRAHTNIDPAKPATALVTSGPYRFTRNPIYLGLAAIQAGIAAATQTTWALISLAVVIVVIDRFVIAREERYLADTFGVDYIRYRHQVRRWL